jgi:Ca2+-binding EF-hand superfamily protein
MVGEALLLADGAAIERGIRDRLHLARKHVKVRARGSSARRRDGTRKCVESNSNEVMLRSDSGPLRTLARIALGRLYLTGIRFRRSVHHILFACWKSLEVTMLKLKVTALSLALTGTFVTPGISLADQHEGRMEAAFKKADKDNDGTLDKEEAKAMPRVAKNFDAIDADKDGTVSLDEVKASMKAMKKGMHEKGKAAFEKADKDADGTLDKEEAKAMPRVAKNFDAIDADKDGTVSLDEIHTFMKTQHKGRNK